MLRGETHRRKVEYAQAFDNLKTEDERFGRRLIKILIFDNKYTFLLQNMVYVFEKVSKRKNRKRRF